MLRWAVLAGTVVALISAILLLTRSAPTAISQRNPRFASVMTGPAPKVEIKEVLTYEFGTMPQQSTGKHTWTVKNVGRRDLELWQGTASYFCRATTFKDGAKVIVKPGRSTDIEMVWKTNRVDGNFKKGVNIGTNDLTFASFNLFVHGEIKPPD